MIPLRSRIFGTVLGVLGAILLLPHTAFAQTSLPSQSIPDPQITIPGVSFSDPEITSVGGRIYSSMPFIGEYISQIYQYGVGLGIIVAIIMIIVAGLQWASSAGNESTISSAKDRIGKAVFGLVLIISSYTILHTINPELVRFDDLNILYIEQEELPETISADFHNGMLSSVQGTSAKGLNQPTGKTVPVFSSECTNNPSEPSGIGTPALLGQLDCNVRYQRKLEDIHAVIIHEGGTDVQKTVTYWKNRCENNSSNCVASHYFIDRDGTIYQLLDEKKVGIHTPGTGEFGSWNKSSIGIDLAINTRYADRSTSQCLQCAKTGSCKSYSGKSRTLENTLDTIEEAKEACMVYYTDEQYAALRSLILSVSKRTNVSPNNGTTVRTHCNTGHNHVDPRNFDWRKIGISNPLSQDGCLDYPAYEAKYTKQAQNLYN